MIQQVDEHTVLIKHLLMSEDTFRHLWKAMELKDAFVVQKSLTFMNWLSMKSLKSACSQEFGWTSIHPIKKISEFSKTIKYALIVSVLIK